MIRNRPEARWLPSRCHFAIFRLYAYTRLVRGEATDEVPTAYVVDPGQNALENFSVSALYFAATASFIAAALQHWLPLPVAGIAGVVAAPAIVHLPYFAVGLIVMPLWRWITGRPQGTNVPATSFGTMAVLLAASVWFALRPGWPKVVGMATMGLFVLNGVAKAILLLLRDRIARAEARCGV